jgi:phospholipid/cholesterol/gamma-HCH transport system ATP-binding protein
MTGTIVEINNLWFEHENGRTIFEDISMAVERGKITAIMGPSGSGKTTLLRLIGGQLLPTKGIVQVEGKDIGHLSTTQLYILRKSMGMLFQNSGLFTHLNVFDNVAFPLKEHTKLPASMIRTLVLLKLQMVGLRGAAKLFPSELSGGMARRVALARAIALDPRLIMYDEPFTGQDPISMGVLIKLIKILNQSLNLTTVIVSHDVAETFSIADYIYVIADKKMIAHGKPKEILHIKNDKLEQFVKGLPDGPVHFDYPHKPIAEELLA